ncbi:peptide-methionine (S)-S-oxide reductase MsrA [Sporosarcina aquimarina]|uniref:peptide-methionine (S)-S-oxide reductase MsrA n=1 Tax=Sporosarcina aquimarina TaxID=114975 RepID=UPI00203AC46B|nr:peptide-methionine (S)-S-oxide reductase MsrA [Sporosarcina aquimarina]MCM3758303.1 peptide-methionine (S)-S-oxide reductase MsrA [Sporosarcina aquimarina]
MKRKIMLILMICTVFLLASCGDNAGRPSTEPEPEDGYVLKDDVTNINEALNYDDSEMHKIYFAGGCFWGVEAYFAKLYGVQDTVSGYANGTGENPSYEDVIKGDRDFVETVEVTYDPDRISLESLIDHLFQVIDPTSVDKQGNDVGVQYRSGIYYSDESDAEIVKEAVKDEQQFYKKDIVTEAAPLDNFYKAEEFHQDYLVKNPNGYCHINLQALNDVKIQPIIRDEEIVKQLSKPKEEKETN